MDARLCPTALKKETWRGQGTPPFPILHLCFLAPSDGSWKAERGGVRQKKERKGEDASDERDITSRGERKEKKRKGLPAPSPFFPTYLPPAKHSQRRPNRSHLTRRPSLPSPASPPPPLLHRRTFPPHLPPLLLLLAALPQPQPPPTGHRCASPRKPSPPLLSASVASTATPSSPALVAGQRCLSHSLLPPAVR
ncbi:hypothetical protein BHE74_00049843 [Ensete ventricosum]|nr:hypothetical protein GW17_00050138 [Ensete ventricosum]RWW44394.1 hypothetical protein BHE74_00049843 [Ensete ventricosum]